MPIFTRDVRKYVFKKIFRVLVLRGAWLDWELCEQVFCPRVVVEFYRDALIMN